MEFKFNVGEEVQVKMVFAFMSKTEIARAPGRFTKVTKRELWDNKPRYKCKGMTGYFPEECLFKI